MESSRILDSKDQTMKRWRKAAVGALGAACLAVALAAVGLHRQAFLERYWYVLTCQEPISLHLPGGKPWLVRAEGN